MYLQTPPERFLFFGFFLLFYKINIIPCHIIKPIFTPKTNPYTPPNYSSENIVIDFYFVVNCDDVVWCVCGLAKYEIFKLCIL